MSPEEKLLIDSLAGSVVESFSHGVVPSVSDLLPDRAAASDHLGVGANFVSFCGPVRQRIWRDQNVPVIVPVLADNQGKM